jgi:hypothetical protein
MQIDERLRSHLARIHETDSARGWDGGPFIANLASGDTAQAGVAMKAILEECRQYQDCTDFRLNRLLRAHFLHPILIPADVQSLFRDTALAARYYGGHRPAYPMFYNSENHHMNWATAEYLVAQMFPDATFAFDGRSSRDHHARARFLIAHWINCRARWGYAEWNSSCYMGVNLMSLLNLADFAAEPDIRRLAQDAVTRLLADLAADSLEGMVFGAQARLYEPQLFQPRTQPAALALVLLLGAGDPTRLGTGPGVGEFVATTTYRPPAWLSRLAREPGLAPLNRERHREEKDILYYCRSAFWRPPFELTNEQARQSFAPHCLHETFIRTERSEHHLVSAAMTAPDHPMDRSGGQSISWMGCLGGEIPIFTTHPPEPITPKLAQEYWAGSASTPRCHLADGVAAAVYRGRDGMDLTHAHFPTARFDAWRQIGRWFFGQYRNACVGLLAPEGACLTDSGEWAGREIRAPGRNAAWIAVFQTSRSAPELGAFSEHCRRDIQTVFDPATASLDLRTWGRQLRVSHAGGVLENGKPLDLAGWKQLDNAIVQAPYGEPTLRAALPGEPESVLDHSRADAIMRDWERRD